MDFDVEYVLKHATNAQKIALLSGKIMSRTIITREEFLICCR